MWTTVQFPCFWLRDPSLLACLLFHCPNRKIKKKKRPKLSCMKPRFSFFFLSPSIILFMHLHFLISRPLVSQSDFVVQLHLSSQGSGLRKVSYNFYSSAYLKLMYIQCSHELLSSYPLLSGGLFIGDARPSKSFTVLLGIAVNAICWYSWYLAAFCIMCIQKHNLKANKQKRRHKNNRAHQRVAVWLSRKSNLCCRNTSFLWMLNTLSKNTFPQQESVKQLLYQVKYCNCTTNCTSVPDQHSVT